MLVSIVLLLWKMIHHHEFLSNKISKYFRKCWWHVFTCLFLFMQWSETAKWQMSAFSQWVTRHSNHITSSAAVNLWLPDSILNRNVWYSWTQVMIQYDAADDTCWTPKQTHTHICFKGLTHHPQSHPLPTVMSWLLEISQTLRQDSQRERGRKVRERDETVTLIPVTLEMKFPLCKNSWGLRWGQIWLALFMLQR